MDTSVRISSIDYMKVICITTMVLCHYGFQNELVVQLIYGFHMPMLFIISGYLYKPRSYKDELKAFGVPILFYILINIVWDGYLGVFYHKGESVLSFLSKEFYGLFTINPVISRYSFDGEWFVISLFITRLFFDKVKIEKYGMILSVIGFLVVESNNLLNYSPLINELHILKILHITPLFYFGYIVKKNNIVQYFNRRRYAILYSCILVICYLFVCSFNGKIDMFCGDYGNSYILTFVGASLLFVAFSNLLDIKLYGIIKMYSIGTFMILGTHLIGFKSLIKYFERIVVNHDIAVILCELLYLIIIYYFIKLSNQYCPIFLGKLSRK